MLTKSNFVAIHSWIINTKPVSRPLSPEPVVGVCWRRPARRLEPICRLRRPATLDRALSRFHYRRPDPSSESLRNAGHSAMFPPVRVSPQGDERAAATAPDNLGRPFRPCNAFEPHAGSVRTMKEEASVVDATSKSGDTAQSTTAQPSPPAPALRLDACQEEFVSFQSGCALLQAPVFQRLRDWSSTLCSWQDCPNTSSLRTGPLRIGERMVPKKSSGCSTSP